MRITAAAVDGLQRRDSRATTNDASSRMLLRAIRESVFLLVRALSMERKSSLAAWLCEREASYSALYADLTDLSRRICPFVIKTKGGS